MFTSYAQNFEDVILARVFRGKERGFYVDVGASHPLIDNVTQGFYERGWSGINIEPLPERIAELAYARPRDLNLRIAVAEAPGRATFHVFPRWHGLSTLDGTIAADMTRWGDVAHPVEVEIRTLDAVLAEAGVERIDFLKIDVEGAEGRVLAGLDLTRWRPTVILLEATYPTTAEPNHQGWEPGLLAKGYRFVLFDGLNRFYLAEEAADLEPSFRLPPNVFDRWAPAPRSDPLTDGEHPDRAFALHLARTWLGALGAVDEDALERLFAFGLPAPMLAAPLTDESFGAVFGRVFGIAPEPAEAAAWLGRPLVPTAGACLAELVRGERFHALRSRLALGTTKL